MSVNIVYLTSLTSLLNFEEIVGFIEIDEIFINVSPMSENAPIVHQRGCFFMKQPETRSNHIIAVWNNYPTALVQLAYGGMAEILSSAECVCSCRILKLVQ